MSKIIPLSIPNFSGNERKYVDDAISQGWVSTAGQYIVKLEQQLSEYLDVDSITACQSGTSAIHLALVDCDVQPGDMVIVPTLTFIAAVNPVRYQFAEPVFMDCDDSLCMDPQKLRRFCKEECEIQYSDESTKLLIHKATSKVIKAIIVVHVFGNMADMEAIMDIATEFGLKVIEDATEALGTKYISGKFVGKYAGTIGDYGVFSFNGNKIITTGGGGAITAKNSISSNHIKYLSTQAKDDTYFYIHNEVGYNYRMTNVQAAIGIAQMEQLEAFVEVKNKNYEIYKALFDEIETFELLSFIENVRSNKWFYSIRLNRDRVKTPLRTLISTLNKVGIQTRAIWGLIHQQKPYASCIAYNITKALEYSDTVINIPCSTNLAEDDIIYCANALVRHIK